LVKFFQNGEEIGTLQFPITEAGTSTSISFMIENTSQVDDVELIFFSEDGDMTADNYPQHLKPRESKQAKIVFSPTKERPDSLHTKWGFREIVG